jgi:hypothetical protein
VWDIHGNTDVLEEKKTSSFPYHFLYKKPYTGCTGIEHPPPSLKAVVFNP